MLLALYEGVTFFMFLYHSWSVALAQKIVV